MAIDNHRAAQLLAEMEIDEIRRFDNYEVLRVPGGWVYTNYQLNTGAMSCCFVPLFQEPVTNGKA